MRLILFLLFPFIEIYLFIQVGDEVGYLVAFAGLILAFIIGVNLFRFVGAANAQHIMASFTTAQTSPAQLGSMMAKIVAAVLLMIPGYLSDLLALLILFPPTRSLLMLVLIKRMMKSGSMRFGFGPFQAGQHNPFRQSNTHDHGDVIEGEATEVKPEESRIEKKN